MEKQSFVHDFQQKLLEMFRASPAADLERNIKALMGQTFNKLELVTRDEFEIQVELLRALRARVEALESKLDQPLAAAQDPFGDRSQGAAAYGSPPPSATPFSSPSPSGAAFPGTSPSTDPLTGAGPTTTDPFRPQG